jgi:hypothetical protein
MIFSWLTSRQFLGLRLRANSTSVTQNRVKGGVEIPKENTMENSGK